MVTSANVSREHSSGDLEGEEFVFLNLSFGAVRFIIFFIRDRNLGDIRLNAPLENAVHDEQEDSDDEDAESEEEEYEEEEETLNII